MRGEPFPSESVYGSGSAVPGPFRKAFHRLLVSEKKFPAYNWNPGFE